MIIFINGCFGIGKSAVAEHLVSEVSNSLLYDAEEVGYMLRKIYKPIDNPEDFQDLVAWRVLTVKTAELLKQQYGRNLIMPMCIWNGQYFDEVISGLKAIDNDFYHFCLVAEEQTILERQNKRSDSPEVTKWVRDRMEKCLVTHNTPKFDVRIQTDGKSIKEIANEILGKI